MRDRYRLWFAAAGTDAERFALLSWDPENGTYAVGTRPSVVCYLIDALQAGR